MTRHMKEAMVRTIGVAMHAILPILPMLAVDCYVSRRIEAERDGIRVGGLDLVMRERQLVTSPRRGWVLVGTR
jgi:hypothetical protein